MYGAICVANAPRENALQAVRKLKRIGIKRLIIVTGDNARMAKAMGKQLKIDEAFAQTLPEEKVLKVKELEAADLMK